LNVPADPDRSGVNAATTQRVRELLCSQRVTWQPLVQAEGNRQPLGRSTEFECVDSQSSETFKVSARVWGQTKEQVAQLAKSMKSVEFTPSVP
jgi:hypothetical protein